jgi:hypothetical protein
MQERPASRSGAEGPPVAGGAERHAENLDGGAAEGGTERAGRFAREVSPPVASRTPAAREAESFQSPPTREFQAFAQARENAGARTGAGVGPEAPGAGADPGGMPEAGAVDASQVAAVEGLRRVARAKEKARARVERMREEALVTLEEPPDDSGLSFILIAVVCFAIFVLLLYLSTTVIR